MSGGRRKKQPSAVLPASSLLPRWASWQPWPHGSSSAAARVPPAAARSRRQPPRSPEPLDPTGIGPVPTSSARQAGAPPRQCSTGRFRWRRSQRRAPRSLVATGQQLVKPVHPSGVPLRTGLYQAFGMRSPVVLSPWCESTSTFGPPVARRDITTASVSARSGTAAPRSTSRRADLVAGRSGESRPAGPARSRPRTALNNGLLGLRDRRGLSGSSMWRSTPLCGGDSEFAPPIAVEGAPVCLGGQAAGWVRAQAGASTQVPPLRVSPRASRRRRYSAATRWCSHRSLRRAPTNRSRRLRPATSQEIDRTAGRSGHGLMIAVCPASAAAASSSPVP